MFCPVGKLLPGVQVVVMDDNMTVQPTGVRGEVHIVGPSLPVSDSVTVISNKQRLTRMHGVAVGFNFNEML